MVSDYEKQRLTNIERNEAKLRQLGLQKEPSRRKGSRTTRTHVTRCPTRTRSSERDTTRRVPTYADIQAARVAEHERQVRLRREERQRHAREAAVRIKSREKTDRSPKSTAVATMRVASGCERCSVCNEQYKPRLDGRMREHRLPGGARCPGSCADLCASELSPAQ